MLSVHGSDALRAAVLALKLARREIRNEIARATRSEISPVWRDAVAAHARTPLERAVIAKGARIAAGNPPAAVAASSSRKLKGGLVPSAQFYAIEFGANTEKVTRYARTSPKGRRHTVTRATARQLPQRRRTGRVAYRALEDVAPRIASLWVSLIVRKFNEAVEKGA